MFQRIWRSWNDFLLILVNAFGKCFWYVLLVFLLVWSVLLVFADCWCFWVVFLLLYTHLRAYLHFPCTICLSPGHSAGAFQSRRPQAPSLWARSGWRLSLLFLHLFLFFHPSSSVSRPQRHSPAVSGHWPDARGPAQCHHCARLAAIQAGAQ